MKRLLPVLAASALVATPASAQPAGHDSHASEHPPIGPSNPDPHAGHQMPVAPKATDPHASHAMPTEQPADPHVGHDMRAATVDPPVAAAPAEALTGPRNAADTVWGEDAMNRSRAVLLREHGDMPMSKILVDQLEARVRKGRDGYSIKAEGWYGGDVDKLWLKSEIEGEFGHKPEQAEVQSLWSHAVTPWFDVQTGIRFDTRPENRGYLVLGVEGFAPFWIEVDAAAFLSNKGDVTARIEAEHDARITQKLILQPRVEADFAFQDLEDQRIGSGLSKAELGFRLRYEIVPQFAPYVGVEYERPFGDTRGYRRLDGDDTEGWSFLTGVRAWF